MALQILPKLLDVSTTPHYLCQHGAQPPGAAHGVHDGFLFESIPDGLDEVGRDA
jgi:hypothetical protein